MNIKTTKLLLRAIDIWGIHGQVTKTVEELAELTVELAKFLNYDGSIDRICDEIADVQIMLDQMKLIHGPGKVNARIQVKLNRLEGTLKGEDSDE